MYTLVISVPFRRMNDRVCEVAGDWGKSIVLLRDSLQGRFGPLVIAAPEVAGDGLIGSQIPMPLHEHEDGVSFVRIGWSHWRARDFWRHVREVRSRCADLASQSDVIHAGINDLWRPYSVVGFSAGWQANRTTVFVLDTDIVLQMEQLSAGRGLLSRVRGRVHGSLYSRVARKAVSRADLALLKGQALHDRYGRYAKNARDFYDTSYSDSDVIASQAVEGKCDEVGGGSALRCLALGRLVPYKGVDHTIRAVADSAAAGAAITLDIIGAGPEESALRRLVEQLNASAFVRFLGVRRYGPELLREISSYHVFMFTPGGEDTPRALFDGLAGGCALAAYGIPFARQLAERCNHGVIVARGDWKGLSASLVGLHRDRARLGSLMRSAAAAAPEHSAETWYRRRAEWTFEAHERRLRG